MPFLLPLTSSPRGQKRGQKIPPTVNMISVTHEFRHNHSPHRNDQHCFPVFSTMRPLSLLKLLAAKGQGIKQHVLGVSESGVVIFGSRRQRFQSLGLAHHHKLA